MCVLFLCLLLIPENPHSCLSVRSLACCRGWEMQLFWRLKEADCVNNVFCGSRGVRVFCTLNNESIHSEAGCITLCCLRCGWSMCCSINGLSRATACSSLLGKKTLFFFSGNARISICYGAWRTIWKKKFLFFCCDITRRVYIFDNFIKEIFTKNWKRTEFSCLSPSLSVR